MGFVGRLEDVWCLLDCPAIDQPGPLGGPRRRSPRATGTNDVAPGILPNDPQQYPQQYGRQRARAGAARCAGGTAAPLRFDARKALNAAEKTDAAASSDKATREI